MPQRVLTCDMIKNNADSSGRFDVWIVRRKKFLDKNKFEEHNWFTRMVKEIEQKPITIDGRVFNSVTLNVDSNKDLILKYNVVTSSSWYKEDLGKGVKVYGPSAFHCFQFFLGNTFDKKFIRNLLDLNEKVTL